MDRCPICRARFRGEPVCRRCRTDLIPLQKVRSRADHLSYLAVQAIISGSYSKARDYISRARFLCATPFILCLEGFIEERFRQNSLNHTS